MVGCLCPVVHLWRRPRYCAFSAGSGLHRSASVRLSLDHEEIQVSSTLFGLDPSSGLPSLRNSEGCHSLLAMPYNPQFQCAATTIWANVTRNEGFLTPDG